MADFSGQSIGCYYVIKPLGEGGMATVYKAYDMRLEREVAVKFTRTSANPGVRLLKCFEYEAKRMEKFNELSIVGIINYRENECAPYLVMP